MTDRISDLPDALLSRILSFLPTKVAISTALLSKRWSPLCLSLPTLHFDDETFLNSGGFPSFVRFVYAVLVLREDQPITTFRLECQHSYDSSDINAWVRAAIQRKVEHLDLSLPLYFNTVLASGVFICETLVVLKLNGLAVRGPSSVSLPSLKLLHLQSVHFSDYQCIAKILSGCTGLESLVLKSLSFVNASECVNFERLSKLVTAEIPSSFSPLEAVGNVKCLRLSLYQYSPRHDVPRFDNLVRMELKFSNYKRDLLIKILQNSPKLQFLVIMFVNRFSTNVKDQKWMCPTLVPECLSSNLTTFHFREYKGLESELQFARYVMKNARALRTMKICSVTLSNSDKKLQMLQKLSQCPRISVTCELLFE